MLSSGIHLYADLLTDCSISASAFLFGDHTDILNYRKVIRSDAKKCSLFPGNNATIISFSQVSI